MMIKNVYLFMAASNMLVSLLSGDMIYSVAALLWLVLYEIKDINSKLTIVVNNNK